MREWRVIDGACGAVYVCGGESKGACVGLSSVRGLCRAGDGVDLGERRRSDLRAFIFDSQILYVDLAAASLPVQGVGPAIKTVAGTECRGLSPGGCCAGCTRRLRS